jgi:Xaa-Pro aminopeptidase
MTQRIAKVKKFLRETSVDAVLISSPSNIVYVSGFSGFSSIERDGYVVITKTASYILTNALYAEAVKSQVPHMELLEYSARTRISDHLETLTQKHKLQTIGFEEENLTISEWKSLTSKVTAKFIPVVLDEIRIHKDKDEIVNITKAAAIADAALEKTMAHITPGMTEKQLVLLLENEMRNANADTAFPTIVAFGKNAAIPHHKSDSTKVKGNDLILIDFGAAYNEYRSDMTRTLFIGKANHEQKKAYQAVLDAQQKAVEIIQKKLVSSSSQPLDKAEDESRSKKLYSSRLAKARSNNKILASEIDKAARDHLVSLHYPSIPHSLGHGIGLAVHESPSLSPRSEDVLTEGMVFSIEPGIYSPGKFGIRIEDLYTIDNGTLKQLTYFPSHLMEI